MNNEERKGGSDENVNVRPVFNDGRNQDEIIEEERQEGEARGNGVGAENSRSSSDIDL